MPDSTIIHELHSTLYPRFRQYGINLSCIVPSVPVASLGAFEGVSATYLRPLAEAQNIQRMMGIENGERVDIRLHPVIELREQSNGLVLELLMTPAAWWYQQNFIGKLSLERHFYNFHRVISRLGGHFRVGFWQGLHLDELHLTASHLRHPVLCQQWMATYSDARDTFRIGVWYGEPSVDALTLFRDFQALYTVYEYVNWSSDNDFRAFYQPQTMGV